MKLYKGDCKDILKSIPDNSVDMVLIDPPYEVGTTGGGLAKKREFYNEIDFMSDGFSEEVLELLVEKMKKINIYIFCSKKQLNWLITFFKNKGCNWDILSWHKTNPAPFCNNKYLNDTEFIFFAREKGVKVYGNYHTKKTYFVQAVNQKDKKKWGHPTIKPVNILETLITNSTNEGDTVLDCFMGSGSTGVACKNTNRDFIGIELLDEYFEVAKERIESNE